MVLAVGVGRAVVAVAASGAERPAAVDVRLAAIGPAIGAAVEAPLVIAGHRDAVDRGVTPGTGRARRAAATAVDVRLIAIGDAVHARPGGRMLERLTASA